MNLHMLRWPTLALLLAGAACGDIGNVRVEVAFPDADTEIKTQALQFIVRELPDGVQGCDNFWNDDPAGLAENRSVVLYPNRNDVVAAPVKLSIYPKLTLIVFAHTTTNVVASRPIAGGCREIVVDPDSTSTIPIALEKPTT